MHTSLRVLKLAALAAAAAVLVGCATPASQQAMSVGFGESATATSPNLKGAFSVRNVTGGKDTNPMWTSQVDNAGFKAALTQSMAVTGFGSLQSGAAKYTVDAELQRLDQPLFGLTLDVVSTVLYRVEGAGVQKTVPVTATGTATMSDAFVAIERLRMANEKSIRENIKEFLRQLTTLGLD